MWIFTAWEIVVHKWLKLFFYAYCYAVFLSGENGLTGIEQMYWRFTDFAECNLFIRVCHPRFKFIPVFDKKSSPYWNSVIEEFSEKFSSNEIEVQQM